MLLHDTCSWVSLLSIFCSLCILWENDNAFQLNWYSLALLWNNSLFYSLISVLVVKCTQRVENYDFLVYFRTGRTVIVVVMVFFTSRGKSGPCLNSQSKYCLLQFVRKRPKYIIGSTVRRWVKTKRCNRAAGEILRPPETETPIAAIKFRRSPMKI